MPGSVYYAELPCTAAQVAHCTTSGSTISVQWGDITLKILFPFYSQESESQRGYVTLQKLTAHEWQSAVLNQFSSEPECSSGPFRLLPSLLLPCHTATCSQSLRPSVPPVFLRTAARGEIQTDKVYLSAGGGHWAHVSATQTLWCQACILMLTHPLHAYQPEPGCHATCALLHHG